MGLKICSLGSGSSGNAIYIADPTSAILVDEGIPVKRVEACLKVLGAPRIPALVITHAHSDHIGQVPAFVRKYGSQVYCSESCYRELLRKGVPSVHLIRFDGDFFIGNILVSPFPISHDVPCLGYSFTSGGSKISVATDIGVIPDKVIERMADSDVVMLECNHDESLVHANPKYTAALKRRILSAKGHLSNAACAEAAVKLADRGVKQIILAHLSKENNYPELAYSTVSDRLHAAGFDGVKVEVATQDRMSGLYEVV